MWEKVRPKACFIVRKAYLCARSLRGPENQTLLHNLSEPAAALQGVVEGAKERRHLSLPHPPPFPTSDATFP